MCAYAAAIAGFGITADRCKTSWPRGVTTNTKCSGVDRVDVENSTVEECLRMADTLCWTQQCKVSIICQMRFFLHFFQKWTFNVQLLLWLACMVLLVSLHFFCCLSFATWFRAGGDWVTSRERAHKFYSTIEWNS